MMQAHHGVLFLQKSFWVSFFALLSPAMFRSACIARLIPTDDRYAQPVVIFQLVERQAKQWPENTVCMSMIAADSVDILAQDLCLGYYRRASAIC